MNHREMDQLWRAIRVVRERTEGRAKDVKNAVFREHFVDPSAEGDTSDEAKVEVAALRGNLRIERERRL